MPLPLEDYALVGDTQTAALVGRDGSIDWMCIPRFDSPSCFAALLGTPDHGRWHLGPRGDARTSWRYVDETLILETTHETDEGAVRVLDFMPPREKAPDIVRIVEGIRGRVPMTMELVVRFDYGHVVPWVRRLDGALFMVGGPDSLTLRTPVETRGENLTTRAEFVVAEGDRIPFVLTWNPSHEPMPREINPDHALEDTRRWWAEWGERCSYEGEWRDDVLRSLTVLKALTYAPTGGIVAAPTTSIPEQLGGVRNWDYRYCWIRDATFTLYALMLSGFRDEAAAWRDWLLRTVAGDPADFQILYGVRGERRVAETELPWLPGYEDSRPVRVGNAAARQLQLDVYGEVMDALYFARKGGLPADDAAWSLQRLLLEYLEGEWRFEDEGIWEVRGPRRHFTHSKVMAWVAFDRAVKAVEHFDRPADAIPWKRLRDEIHEDICRNAFDTERNAFVQYYGAKSLDASTLLIPLVGFLPPDDPRVAGTVDAILAELVEDGLVRRYLDDETMREVDGLPPGEGSFLPCSFWLVDNLSLLGRKDEARALFERLLSLRTDLGLLAEEYDSRAGRLVGNFPQAFSHVGLVNSAFNLSTAETGSREEWLATPVQTTAAEPDPG
jgi:GH15 family glucan-1,4-alpha-glucosidase